MKKHHVIKHNLTKAYSVFVILRKPSEKKKKNTKPS